MNTKSTTLHATSFLVLVTKSNEEYGHGFPGWNAGIKITYSFPEGDGRRAISGRPTFIVNESWPMVNAPQSTRFVDFATQREAYRELPEGWVEWDVVAKYLDEYTKGMYDPTLSIAQSRLTPYQRKLKSK